MESFNLLSYWRNGGRAAANVPKTTTATATLSRSTKQFKKDVVDDGHFFDLNFTLTANSRQRFSLSDPSNNLLSHRRLPSAKPNSMPRLQFPFTVTTSPATKVHVLMKQQRQQNISKFPIKIKVVELPLASLFTRDNTARSKKALQKYVSKIKPLYVGISKRYGEVLRLSGLVLGFDGEGDGVKSPKAGMRVAGKRLGKKSKSAPLAFTTMQAVQAQRIDDSLRQQEDGIQSAIAHCKQSLTSVPGRVGRSMSDLGGSRSGSHPAYPILIGRD